MLKTILATGLALSPLAASAQMVNAEDPERLAQIIRAEGYPVEVGTDNVGDPKITGKIRGTTFNVFFYDCTDNRNCLTLQFQAAYDVPNGISLERANQWNMDRRYASVYLDAEYDPFLEMDLNIDYDVTEENFLDNFLIWANVIGEFEDFINW
ncbi:YbjN domain-containing protein [Pseudoponticoccus marisrubri]|uniref:YbjN domain-containing protein n=1 Tax=Pseudoponticoccus marisrubri TaxID=1685382 RepID=A0A0W7WPZ9_9RHOB|nr:YbjN domain-containing protein [Pseudoponticoccus marisrubri]KUF12580.1 hypothetical protein AVJ23_02300 [Pseudoponticoccus marisrubri]